MNEMELIGWFITIAITLLGGFKLLAKPMATMVERLVERLTRLDDSVNNLNNTLIRQEHILDNHGQRLDNLEHQVIAHGVEIDHLKETTHELTHDKE